MSSGKFETFIKMDFIHLDEKLNNNSSM